MLRMTAQCPRYNEALQEVLQLPEVQRELRQTQQLFENLQNFTGMNISSAADVTSLFITLWAEQLYGLELPEWTTGYYPQQMEFMASQSYVYNAYTTEMRRIKGGPFLKEFLKQLNNFVAGARERKMYLY